MKVAFLGFQKWGLVTLRAILESGHQVGLVITHPEATDPYGTAFPDSVAEFADARGLPCVVASSANRQVFGRLEVCRPDVLITSNWRRKLGDGLFAVPRLGSFNIHRGLLPNYGGLAPINWAVANGEAVLGVTVHRLEAGMDLGAIAFQQNYSLEPAETATDAFEKSSKIVRDLVPQLLDRVLSQTLELREQNPDEIVYYHRRGERELRIDWNASLASVFNLIRAQSDPFPNAFTYLDGQRLLIKSARLPEFGYRGTPGRTVDRCEDGVVVLCGRTSKRNQGLVLQKVAHCDHTYANANLLFKSLDAYLGE